MKKATAMETSPHRTTVQTSPSEDLFKKSIASIVVEDQLDALKTDFEMPSNQATKIYHATPKSPETYAEGHGIETALVLTITSRHRDEFLLG